jgi:hypothetical protein
MLSTYQKEQIGHILASTLKVKKVKGFNPKRYNTTWGIKTALGLYETVYNIINNIPITFNVK